MSSFLFGSIVPCPFGPLFSTSSKAQDILVLLPLSLCHPAPGSFWSGLPTKQCLYAEHWGSGCLHGTRLPPDAVSTSSLHPSIFHTAAAQDGPPNLHDVITPGSARLLFLSALDNSCLVQGSQFRTVPFSLEVLVMLC